MAIVNVTTSAEAAGLYTDSTIQTEGPVTSNTVLAQDTSATNLETLLGAGPVVSEETGKKTVPGFGGSIKDYIANGPKILFDCDYIVDDELVGVLLVWQKFYNSTHYEVFKQNIFQSEADFSRILFLDTKSLEEETGYFIGYIKETLGFMNINQNDVLIILDDKIKKDRLYQYKVVASQVPSVVDDISFNYILESQGNLISNIYTRDSGVFLQNISASTYGRTDLGWLIVLVNDFGRFFGITVKERPFHELIQIKYFNELGEYILYTPRYYIPILEIIQESVSLFGIKETFRHVLEVLGGLSSQFMEIFLESIDVMNSTFSYDIYKEKASTVSAVFGFIEEHSATSFAFIPIPSATGTESLMSIDSMSKIFKFVNDLYMIHLYSLRGEYGTTPGSDTPGAGPRADSTTNTEPNPATEGGTNRGSSESTTETESNEEENSETGTAEGVVNIR